MIWSFGELLVVDRTTCFRHRLRYTLPRQPILLRLLRLFVNGASGVEHVRGIRRRRRRQRRVRFLESRGAQAYVINAQIRPNHCQIVGTSCDVGRPVTYGIPGREIVRIDDIDQKETQDEPENPRDRAVHYEQRVGEEQVGGDREDPVQNLRDPEGVCTQCHLYWGVRFAWWTATIARLSCSPVGSAINVGIWVSGMPKSRSIRVARSARSSRDPDWQVRGL
jgi:hypothetical protein